MEKEDELDILKKAPRKLLTAQMFLDKYPGIVNGVWIEVVQKAVYLNQLDGITTSEEEAWEDWIKFQKLFEEKIALAPNNSDIYHNDNWRTIVQMEDPRSFLMEILTS